MVVIAQCLRCNGSGERAKLSWGSAPMDPDARWTKWFCGACEGSGSIELHVESDDPDIVHDACVDEVYARGFNLRDDQ